MRNDLGKGSWLVVVEDNCTSTTPIDPDFTELDAALYYVKEAMIKAMSEKSKMRPKSVRMSNKELKAWKAYEKIMGDDKPAYFEFASLDEIAKAGCEVIKSRSVSNKKKYRKKCKNKIENMNSILELEV